MSELSHKQRLIELVLGEPVAEFVAQRRPHTSWRSLAKDITARTDVSITGEALRQWMDGRLAVEVKVVVPAEAASRPPSKPATGSPPTKPPQPRPQTSKPKVDAGAAA